MKQEHNTPSFYSLRSIDQYKAIYNIIIGERSNGKTYACLARALSKYISSGEQSAYLRRFKEDFRGKRGQQLFAAHEANSYIRTLTGGKWDRVRFYSGKWHLARMDADLEKLIYDETPFMFGFSLNDMEHDKSISYPNVTTIIYDEFLTRQYYLPDEFILFMNVLSTIIRHRDNVKIYMLGNTVNKYCPYFKEMGLSHVADMPEGKIDVYTYGNSSLSVAVERCKSPSAKGKASDKYFAFDNPALAMITGGAWEIDIYPHLPTKYNHSDIAFTYFISFDDNLLQAEVISLPNMCFTYIHEKTTPIQHPETDVVFTEEYDARPNYFRNLTHPTTSLGRRIYDFFRSEKVFYQDNEVGEVVNNYIKFCNTQRR